MYRILQTGRTSLDAFQKKMDTISNNIANVQTHGYKGLKVQFEDLVYDQIANRGVPLSQEARAKSVAIGTGSKVKSTERVFEQGILENTSAPYHLAVEGEGFFGVRDENGEIFLTRDGGFGLDANGQLVDSRGNRVVMDSFVSLSQWKKDDVTIDERGVILGWTESGESTEIGRIRLLNVPDKNMLVSRGNNYFTVEDTNSIYSNENANEQWGKIHQGFLEKSSVDLGKEMVDMLITQRAYQINTKSIHAADEMWSMVNQLRR